MSTEKMVAEVLENNLNTHLSEVFGFKDEDIESTETAESNVNNEVQEEAPSQDSEADDNQKDEESKAEKQDDRTVPLAALKEERERRKEIRQELDEMRRINKDFQDNIAKLFTKQPEEQGAPDPSEDPLGALQYHVNKLSEKQAQFEEAQKRNEEATQQSSEWNKTAATFQRDVSEFVSKSNMQMAEYADAYKHLMTSRLNELNAMGFSKEEADLVLKNEELTVVNRAIQSGQSPASVVYNLAKMRGYKSVPASQSINKIETLDKGLSASTNLGGGRAPTSKLSLESLSPSDLAKLSDKEFNKLFSNQ